MDVGKNGIYQLKNGKWCCSKSINSCDGMKKKNANSIKALYISGKLNQKNNKRSIESLRRQGWSKGLTKETNESVKKARNNITSKIYKW